MIDDSRLPERFWDKVSIEPNTGCWLWTASVNNCGYGQFGIGGRAGRPWVAHKVAYTWLVGPVPPGLHLDHLCRTRCCVNPDHLEAVTPRENFDRGNGPRARGQQLAARTHCVNGHEFTGERNARQRLCRECRRTAAREYQRRKRAAQR